MVTFLLLPNYIIRCLIHTRHKIQRYHQGEHRNGSLELIKLVWVAITVLREEKLDMLVPKYYISTTFHADVRLVIQPPPPLRYVFIYELDNY